MSADSTTIPALSARRRTLCVCTLLVALVVALYSRVFHAEFIEFDDNNHIFENSAVLAGLRWDAIVHVFTHFIASQWIPLSWLSHMLDVQLFGLDPGWHHLGNVAFHALNACLVLTALHAITREFWPSAIVALLFAVHPINVESVAWAAERKNVLSTAFWLLAMIAYARHTRASHGHWMWAVAAAMALGLMAKPMLVTLPFALLLLDAWPLGRIGRVPWSRLLLEKIPLFALTVASCGSTLAAAAHFDALTNAGQLPITMRLANAAHGYAGYLENLFWPAGLAALYPIKAHYSAREIVPAILVLAAVTSVVFALRRRVPAALIGWLWFLGILVPVSSVFQVGSQAYADRFCYVPQLGIFGALVWSLKALPRPSTVWLRPAVGLAAAILSLLTVRQVGYWMDTATLFEHTLRVTGPNGMASAVAGMGYARHGDFPAAIAHYRDAQKQMPRSADLRGLLGSALARNGQTTEAIHQMSASIALEPRDERVRKNLVALLVQEGRVEEAARLIPR
jgi:hypothetical protein